MIKAELTAPLTAVNVVLAAFATPAVFVLLPRFPDVATRAPAATSERNSWFARSTVYKLVLTKTTLMLSTVQLTCEPPPRNFSRPLSYSPELIEFLHTSYSLVLDLNDRL